MAVLAPPVQVVASGAPPFVAVAGGAPPFVAVSGNAPPITIVASGAPPITLLNEDGSIWAGAGAPVNTVAPVITGTPTVGQTLSCSSGTWTGATPITYNYQWARDGAGIGGANASTYVLVSADIGKIMECEVYAENAAGPTLNNAFAAGVGPVAGLGGSVLLDGETDGFATDFTYATDGYRVAKKAANSVTYLGLESVYTNAGTSPKMVYDINGTLVWTPHNFVVQSNDMSTWTASNTTKDINTITAVASTAIHAVQKNLAATIASAPYTISVTLQAGTWQYAYVTSYRAANTTVSCVVDMVAGTITQTANGASGVASNYGIISEGGGKFRVTFTDSSNSAGANIIVIGFANAATGNTFDATGHLISTTAATDSFGIERVQINRGTTPTAYVPTMTAARMGLMLDYDPVTHALKGLLCEGAGTNLLLQSSQFDNASWSKTAVTVTANATTAPDGTVTADNLIPTAGTGLHTIWGSGTVVSGTNYTFSVYVKPINAQRYVELIYGGATGFKWVSVTFDMQTSTVTQQVNGSDGGNVYTGSSITSVGNGWFRVTLSSAIADTTGSGSIEAVTTGTPTHGSFGNVSWTANGTDGIAAWGAQLEVFTATSPIPTYTTTVTRTADSCGFSSSTISPSVTAGSWWIDVNNFIVANGQMLVKYTSTGIPMGMPSGISISITDGTSISKAWAAAGVHKVASAFQVGDRAITFDGVSVSTDTGQTSGLLAPGATISLGVAYWGYIRKVRYVPRRKTNTELVTETT